MQADLTDLKILDVEAGLDWALLIAFNRGKLEAVKNSRIYRKYAAMAAGWDMIIGCIANDRIQDCKMLKLESEVNRSKGIALADEICRKYRREGQFFDEILKAGD